MAVSSMRIISVIGVISKLEDVINSCGKSKIFHPDNAMNFYNNTKDFKRLADANPYLSTLATLKDKVISSGKTLKFVDIKDFKATSKEIDKYITYLFDKLDPLLNQKYDSQNKISSLSYTIEELEHFKGFSINLEELFSCRYIKVRFGSIPKEEYEKLTSYNENPYVCFFPFTNDESKCWGLYLVPIQKVKEVDKIFKSLYFERVKISINNGTPESHIEKIKELIEEENIKLKDIENKLESFWKTQYDQCMRFYSKIEELNIYFEIKKYVFKYENSFILVGWIPEENIEEVTNTLDSINGVDYTIEYEREGIKFSPPVKLKNKKLFRPFEMFVEMYGLPKYNEVDPTLLMSIVFTFLFGLMFADLGQGLLLSLLGFLLWKTKASKLGQILIPCGISAAIFGTLFGSVFGFEHLLDSFYKNVFGLDHKPIEIMEPKTINMIIISTIGLGGIFLIISMISNIYSSFKVKDYSKAIFGPNGFAGLTLYVSSIMVLICSVAIKANFINIFYILGLIFLPIILILFCGPLGELVSGKKNWFPTKIGEYLTQNFFELFEVVLSYVTNTISFIRIGIFILVHAGMMSVVLTIADLVGGNIGYMIVVIIGNLFVMALEALLVSIQVLRLNFYEMFNRFFSGQGRPYKPILFNYMSNKS